MANPSTPAAPKQLFRNIINANGTAVWQVEGSPKVSPFFYLVNAVELDIDGAPNAYGPKGVTSATDSYMGKNTPLENLRNGGYGETDDKGRPKLPYGYKPAPTANDPWHGKEQAAGPWKGFYISSTTLNASAENRSNSDPKHKTESDPDYYVDATSIPYVALPVKYVKNEGKPNQHVFNQDFADTGIGIGDIVLAINAKTGKRAFAIFADTKKKRHMEEVSPKLVEMLGFPLKFKKHGLTCNQKNPSILYVAFPKSGKGQGHIPSVTEIQNMGATALKAAIDEYQLTDRIPDRFPDFPMIRAAFFDLGGSHVPLKFGRGQCWD